MNRKQNAYLVLSDHTNVHNQSYIYIFNKKKKLTLTCSMY